jgi:hypothetical protein
MLPLSFSLPLRNACTQILDGYSKQQNTEHVPEKQKKKKDVNAQKL